MIRRIKKLPVVLEPEEVERLLSIPDKRYISGIRNKAVLSLMVNMGLRVSEVCNLKPGNVNLTKRKLRIVQGKGRVDRDLIIGLNTAEALRAWKEVKPKNTAYFFSTIRNRKEGIFATTKGSKLSARNISLTLKGYVRRAGIGKNVSPHTLRHTFATNFIRQNGNVMNLMRILGHADISTTQIYVTLANKDIETAMDNFIEFKI